MIFYRFINKDWKKVLEVLIVCATMVTISFLLILFTSDCKKLGLDPTDHPIQVKINMIIKYYKIIFILQKSKIIILMFI